MKKCFWREKTFSCTHTINQSIMSVLATMDDVVHVHDKHMAQRHQEKLALLAARNMALDDLLEADKSTVTAWVTLKDRQNLRVPDGVTHRKIFAKCFGRATRSDKFAIDSLMSVEEKLDGDDITFHHSSGLEQPTLFLLPPYFSKGEVMLLHPELLQAELEGAHDAWFKKKKVSVYFYKEGKTWWWESSTHEMWVWSASPESIADRTKQNAMSVMRVSWMCAVARCHV